MLTHVKEGPSFIAYLCHPVVGHPVPYWLDQEALRIKAAAISVSAELGQTNESFVNRK
jgi:hypothetical protein